MVKHPRDYRWSSYAVNAESAPSELLVPHALYLALGNDPSTRAAAYAELFKTEIDPEETARIRTAVNLGIGVSDARFREQIAAVEQAKKRGGRTRKNVDKPFGKQVDLF